MQVLTSLQLSSFSSPQWWNKGYGFKSKLQVWHISILWLWSILRSLLSNRQGNLRLHRLFLVTFWYLMVPSHHWYWDETQTNNSNRRLSRLSKFSHLFPPTNHKLFLSHWCKLCQILKDNFNSRPQKLYLYSPYSSKSIKGSQQDNRGLLFKIWCSHQGIKFTWPHLSPSRAPQLHSRWGRCLFNPHNLQNSNRVQA